jgi:hypothetical protein
MAAARFGKALTERYPIRTCTWPASEYQLTYGKFVCSLRPVAWNFLWLYNLYNYKTCHLMLLTSVSIVTSHVRTCNPTEVRIYMHLHKANQSKEQDE